LSDTTDMTSDVSHVADDASTGRRRRTAGSGLSAKLLPELQTMAAGLGITGTGRMRKGELIAAISAAQSGGSPRVRAASAPAREEVRAEVPASVDAPAPAESRRRSTRPASAPESQPEAAPTVSTENGDGRAREDRRESRRERGRSDRNDRGDRSERGERSERSERNDRSERSDRGERSERNDRDRSDRGGNDRGEHRERTFDNDSDDDGDGRRSRRSRFRDRRRGRDRTGAESSGGGEHREPQIADDDVLVPVAGIVDVLDNYAFVRTTGYLSGPNDVYVSMSQIKKYGLRRGDAITGAVRSARDGEQRRDKYNPLVRLDTINGMEPEEARRRPEFYKLTPLYPQDRLRLETEPHILTTRVIDLVMPIGKGQRALIVSPPKAGKTMVLQSIANAITTNNPECHLMVVLVDERPEEVTDMQRSVKGEVIASTFDRPPQDHTTVAELAIERAKRLVELGHDVVVLLDSITRLGRAYNLAAPASGRILSGGIDSTALYPPKRFLGAARNIENGGSLTILATALVETGSMMDTVIFEEFKGTGNAELKLDRKIADKRVFPAIDIDPSGTRKEEILLAPEELVIVHKLRKVLHSLESQAALDLLLDKLKQTRTNIEFLMQIAKTTAE
jgi:transcription termination factor Rho